MKTVSSEYINTKFNSKEDYRREDERLDGEIFRIADDIALRCKDKPIVLLSGPSGSGKTTTAHKISRYLDEKGHKTHVISLDNYFKTILPDGQDEVDFESPSRIDSKMLSEHIKKISECKEIELPMFDFLSKKSVSSGVKLKRKKGEVVLFEGIHALNPDAVPIDNETSVKIYASVRTRISCGNEIIHPKFIRLLRRMSRDEIYRGRSVSETADYGSVIVKMSNNVCKTDSGATDNIMIRTQRALAFAKPLTHTEPYRPEKKFADAVKGYILFDAKVVRPKEVININVKYA